MKFDPGQLAPAPWRVVLDPHTGGAYVPRHPGGPPMLLPEDDGLAVDEAAVRFAALARNALDVMLRRGWGVQRYTAPDGSVRWAVMSYRLKTIWDGPDPFTALVEADLWCRDNGEKPA